MDKLDERLDNASCGYLSLDQNQAIINANITFTSILGYNINGLRGAKLESLLSRSSRTFFQLYFHPLIKLNGKIEGMYLSFKSSSGREVPMLVHITTTEKDGQWTYECIIIPSQQRAEYETDASHIKTNG